MSSKPIMSLLSLACFASSCMAAQASWVTLTAEEALGTLVRRDAACGNTTFAQCPDAKLPANFCCAPQQTCITLDNASSALCCPAGANCTSIQPIPCNVQQQNKTAYPETSIMTTKLGSQLPTCGASSCCPFGFTCNKDLCTIVEDSSSLGHSTSSAAASATSSAPSSASSSTATTTTTTTTAAPTGLGSTSPVSKHCDPFPGGAIAAGFFPGVLVGALLCLLGVIFTGRRSSSRPTSSSTTKSKFSHFRGRSSDGAIIGVSEPIPQVQAARTDFLRREEPPQSRLQRTSSRVKSWFNPRVNSIAPSSNNYNMETASYNPAAPYDADHWNHPPLPTNFPVTPPQQIRPAGGIAREPSTESIKVYSPANINRGPSAGTNNGPKLGSGRYGDIPPPPPIPTSHLETTDRRDRPNTTFTDIMERSGYEPGLPPKYGGR